MSWDAELAIGDELVCRLHGFGVEWRLAAEQRVHDAAEGPHLTGHAVTLLGDNLRRDVVGGAAESPLALAIVIHFRSQSKIAQFDLIGR